MMEIFVYGLYLVVRLMNLRDLYSCTMSILYCFRKLPFTPLVIHSYNKLIRNFTIFHHLTKAPSTREQMWSRDKQEVHESNMFVLHAILH